MAKKLPKYIVFNKNAGYRSPYHKPVDVSDDLETLRTYYSGDEYEIMRVVPLVEREEW
ncbi:hypothetical protein [Weissella cibaria]|uniref:hypothetical protein n=1 Tax=Weissella cibaria TaxID=137591 RepID=UPI003D36D324